MASETQIQRMGGITPGMILQTVGGILIALLAWNVNEITKRLESHEIRFTSNAEKITRLEVKGDGVEAFIREIRADMKEIKDELKRRP